MKKQKFQLDWWLLSLTITLLIISVTALLSSYGLYFNNGRMINWEGFVSKQIMWFGVSTGVILIIIHFKNSALSRFSLVFYGFAVVLLLYILVGRNIPVIKSTIPLINGATRWIKVPGIGQFQVSEFAKIAIVFLLGVIAANYTEKTFEPKASSYRALLYRMLLVAILPAMLIFLEPDTGLPVVIIMSTFAMMLAAGIPWRYIFIIIFSVIAFFTAFYLFYSTPFGKSLIDSVDGLKYRMDRFNIFSSGIDTGSSASNLQTENSLISIGSSGLFGHGFQQSTLWIPESQNDFIFSIFASDFGFVGATFTIIISILFDVRIFQIIRMSKRPFEVYCATGFLMIITFQQLFNIGMALGLLPVKGMTLPLISYGGTSMISYAIIIGFLFNMYSNAVNDAQNDNDIETIDAKHLLKNFSLDKTNAPSEQILETKVY